MYSRPGIIIMTEKRLNIINISSSPNEHSLEMSTQGRFKEMQASFERLWLINPERFNPLRNCMEKERLERTWQLLVDHHNNFIDKKVADIGCGAGVFSRRLRDAKAEVVAIDIAENALKCFKEAGAENIQLKRETMPVTHLPDHTYDVIVCTDLIAEIPSTDYRLFFAELARLIKADGVLICSSPIDIDSMGGLDKFVELAQTEFDLIDGRASYHALYLRLKRFFDIPSLFTEAWQNFEFKQKELSARRGLKRWWFWLNTNPLFVGFWYACQFFTQPISKQLKNNQWLLHKLEKLCRFFWDKDGISHYIFIAKRRNLKAPNPEDIPIEKPKRKEVWD